MKKVTKANINLLRKEMKKSFGYVNRMCELRQAVIDKAIVWHEAKHLVTEALNLDCAVERLQNFQKKYEKSLPTKDA